jgi:eukaryotic-like serine/threonine-protein kinase
MKTGTLLAGRYRLDRPIGAGGMGQVWAAYDLVLGREVAIKSQEIGLTDDRALLERFYREAQSAARLQHPNVVTIFDSGTDSGTAFLVMELLPGPNLEAYVAEHGPLPENEVIALAKQAAAGLVAAHAAGVVHRDIKPANLVFDTRGTLKIVDFGIVRLAQAAASRLTATNTVIGSAPYLSPEQIEGHPADERSDIYALGCVMTTMLTGRPPFDGEHPLAVMHQHVSVPPPRISDRRPTVRPALEALVGQMLHKSPQARPESAPAVLDRLRQLELGAPEETSDALAANTAVLGQPTLPFPVSDPAQMPTRVTRNRQERSRARWARVGVAAAALIALVLIVIVTTAGDPAVNDSAEEGSTASTSTAPSPKPTADKSPVRQTTEPSPKATTGASRVPTTRATPNAESTQEALSDLRAAVSAASNSGQIEEKKAEELSKRVDELAKHLADDGAKDSAKRVEELDKYVRELSEKGELTQAGLRRISTALQTVRQLTAEG